MRNRLSDTGPQLVPHPAIPCHEEGQPSHPHLDPRSFGSRAESLGKIRLATLQHGLFTLEQNADDVVY